MEYKGKLYGKLNNKYFDTGKTSDDWDMLEKYVAELIIENNNLKSWKYVHEEIPPSDIDILVESPDNICYLTTWRSTYNIFACQSKEESSKNWKWKLI
jgi:hypothetical protein